MKFDWDNAPYTTSLNFPTFEDIYQAFKERLIEEVVAEERITHDAIFRTPLVDTGVPNTSDFIGVKRGTGPVPR